MIGKAFGMLFKTCSVELRHGSDDARMEISAAIEKDTCVGDLARQRMLEGVFEFWEETPLVQELGAPQVLEGHANLLVGLVRHCLEEGVRNILPDHRCGLEQALVFGSEAVDASGENRLNR